MSAEWVGVIGAVITAIGGVVAIALQNRKTSGLYVYRVEQLENAIKKLEDKQDRHNGWVEKVIRLEGRMDEAEHDIRDLKQKKGA